MRTHTITNTPNSSLTTWKLTEEEAMNVNRPKVEAIEAALKYETEQAVQTNAELSHNNTELKYRVEELKAELTTCQEIAKENNDDWHKMRDLLELARTQCAEVTKNILGMSKGQASESKTN